MADVPHIPAGALELWRGKLDCGPDLGRHIELDCAWSPVFSGPDETGKVQYVSACWAICYELEQEQPVVVLPTTDAAPMPEPGLAGLLAGLLLVVRLRRWRR